MIVTHQVSQWFTDLESGQVGWIAEGGEDNRLDFSREA